MDFRHVLIIRAKPRHKVQHGWNLYRKAINPKKLLVLAI